MPLHPCLGNSNKQLYLVTILRCLCVFCFCTVPAAITATTAAPLPQSDLRIEVSAETADRPPLPRGFDRIIPRQRSPQGFANNNAANTVADIKAAAADGDHVTLTVRVEQKNSDQSYNLCDTGRECITGRLSADAKPEGQQLQPGLSYLIWARVNAGFFSTSLEILIFAPR